MTQFVGCVMTLLVFFVNPVFPSECEAIVSEYSIIATVNETKEWSMRENFFRGEDLLFSTDPYGSPYVQAVQPIQKIGYGTNHGEEDISNVQSIKALTSQETGAWLNDFIFLEQDEIQVDVHYALNDPINPGQVPHFSTYRTVMKNGENLTCFDLDFVTETQVVVDCASEADGLVNAFLFTDLLTGAIIHQANDNPHNYNKTTARKIVTRNYTFSTSSIENLEGLTPQPFIFRSEPAWATESYSKTNLDPESELEVFKLNTSISTNITYSSMLNLTLLNSILPSQVDNFSLIDFQVEPNGDIYVLDAYHGVYVFDLTSEGKFELYDWIELKEQAYAFDFNYLLNPNGYYTKHLVIAHKDRVVIYEDFLFKRQFNLPYTAVYGELQLQMSQEFLVIRQKQGTYLYNINHETLLQQFDDSFQQLLINPYYPDMVGVNDKSAYRYLLTTGTLVLNKQGSSTDSEQYVTLKAQKQNNPTTTCSVLIYINTVAQGSMKLFRTVNDPFPSEIIYPSKSIVVDLLASGPSLTYQQTQNQATVDLTLDSIWEITLTDVELPAAKDVSYADILVLDNASRFYLLLQLPTEECKMYQCTYKETQKTQSSCKLISNFTLTFIIDKSKNSFVWWQQWNQITYAYQNTDYSVQIYTIYGGSNELNGEITYPTDTSNKITSASILQNAAFIVQSNKKVVQVWSIHYPIENIYTIDQTLLATMGYTGTFTPVNVFGNKLVEGQFIFIQTQTEVLIGEFANGNKIHAFHLFKVISILANAEVSIAIGPKTFTIVQKTGSEQLLEEYNWQHKQYIYKTKNLPLYSYTLEEPLNIDYCSFSGWLFVRAYDPSVKQTVILLYEPNVPAHVSLHKVISTGYLINDVFDMAIDGNKQMFIYFNDNKNNKIYTVLQDAILNITPKEGVVQYVSNIETSISIGTSVGSDKLTVNEKMKFMNTHSEMVVRQSVLDQEKYMFKFKKQKETQELQINTDWYDGQPVTLFLLCSQCGDDILIREQIYAVTDGSDLRYTITDGTFYDTDYIVYQADTSLVFQHLNGTMVMRIDLSKELGAGEKCELITVTKDYKHIISTVNSQEGVKVLVNQCTGTQCSQYLQGTQNLPGITKALKMRFVFGRNFIVLNTDADNYQNFESSIVIYSFTTTSTTYAVQVAKLINTQSLNAQTTVYIADFCHLTISDSIYALFISDINNGIWIANFGSNVDGSVSLVHSELINLKSFSHDQYYLQGDTHFHQLKILSSELSDKTYKIQILVTTSNVASYIFYLELSVSSATGASYVKNSLSLQQILLPYGDWVSVNKIAYGGGYVSIAYTDQNTIVLGVYPIQVKKYDSVNTVPFIFGVQANYNSPRPIDFAMLLTTYDKKPYLFANVDYDTTQSTHPVLKYSINEKPYLILKNGDTLLEQTLSVYAANSFNSAVGTTQLWDHDNVPNDEGSSKWWWITLIVIAGVLLLGGIGFFAYKKFANQGVQPLLG